MTTALTNDEKHLEPDFHEESHAQTEAVTEELTSKPPCISNLTATVLDGMMSAKSAM